jgi:acetyl-CoA C-acetyltransferase
MGKPVIVSTARTPFGRRGGALGRRHSTYLLAHVQREVLRRVGLPPSEVGQIVGGCATPVGELGFNTTRMAWLAAGMPYQVAASTIDCVCGSSQQASHMIHNLIAADAIDTGIACGVEVMSRVGMGANTLQGPGRVKPRDFAYDMPDQFVAAERIAKKYGFTRRDLDQVGLCSQQRAAMALEAGRFRDEIAPIRMPLELDAQPSDADVLIEHDEGLRATGLEALAQLKPTLPEGLHTAGNTSQISDGAAALLFMDENKAKALGLRPRARIVDQVLVGTDPFFHIEGPLDATAALLARTGMEVGDIDVFEINEAFAAVVLAWLHRYELDLEQVNVNGGAIALGHPMGATGCRLIATAVTELERTGGAHALVAMCCGGAIATGSIIERI